MAWTHNHKPPGGRSRWTFEQKRASGNTARASIHDATPVGSGAGSARVHTVATRELVEATIRKHPHLVDFEAAVSSWASAEVAVAAIRNRLDEVGAIGEDGFHQELLDALQRHEAAAAKHRRELGMTPMSQAVMRRNDSQSMLNIGAIAERGLKAREAFELTERLPDRTRELTERARAEDAAKRGEDDES